MQKGYWMLTKYSLFENPDIGMTKKKLATNNHQ